MQDIKIHLQHVDGVMIGRQAYKHPQFLLQVDQEIFNQTSTIKKSLNDIVIQYIDYI